MTGRLGCEPGQRHNLARLGLVTSRLRVQDTSALTDQRDREGGKRKEEEEEKSTCKSNGLNNPQC